MKVPAALRTIEGQYAVIAIVGIVVVYYVLKKVLPAAGGLVSGNNAITQNQTDAQGNPVDAYQGGGVVGTLGAAANSASGGTFASLGQWLSGKIASVTMPYDPNSAQPTGVTRDQVVTPNYVPDIGNLTGQAQQSWQ